MRTTTAVHARLDAIARRATADLPHVNRAAIAVLLSRVKADHACCCCSLYPDTLACIPTENRLKRGLWALACGRSIFLALQESYPQFVECAP